MGSSPTTGTNSNRWSGNELLADILARKTESVYAVSYHWGLSRAIVSYYRQQFGVPRLNPGTNRLVREIVIPASRTPEARAKQSAAREGRSSTESKRDRERLRRIQRLTKDKKEGGHDPDLSTTNQLRQLMTKLTQRKSKARVTLLAELITKRLPPTAMEN